nr:hypothetical protein [Tanacetum cinerariifolium]
MANQEHILPQQEQPFVVGKQVSFNLEDIILNTNNEVALLYPEHNNKDYFKYVSDFISKCCLRKPFTTSPDMYKEYLGKFWYSASALENSKVSFSIPTGGIFGEVGLNTFRNSIGAYYLAHSSKYVAPPSIDVVRQWFPTIRYGKDVLAKDHMLAICNANELVAFKAPKPSSIAERVPQGIKPGVQPRHKNQSSSKQTFVSSKEATKGGSSKAPTGSKTGHSKKRKESCSVMDSNPRQPLVSIPVDPGMHKEDQQATGGPTSLGDTRDDASAFSTTEADPGNSAPSDFVPQQQDINKRTKNTSYDHLFVGTDPHVLADQTKSVSEGSDTVFTQPLIGKGASSITRHVEEEEAFSTIRLEDLAKLVSNVQPSFKDVDLHEDDLVIIIEESDEVENEIHATKNVKTEDTSVPKSPYPKSSLIQELTNQPKELLVKSLKTKLSNDLSTNNFSSSLPTELNDIPSKLNELTREVQGLKNQVHNLEFEILGELKEIPTKMENFTKTVTSLTSQVVELKTLQWELPIEFLSLPVQVATVQAKLKTLDVLPGLLSHVTTALNKFAQVLASASSKAEDKSVPSPGQVDTMPAEGERNTNQATISQLLKKRAEKVNLNKTQPEKTTPPLILPIITTTTQMQSPFPQRAPKDSSQTEGSISRKTMVKGYVLRVESSKKKELKKFDFVTKDGEHVHLAKEQINAQKKIEEEAKAEAARCEELGINMDIPLSKQDPLDKLNDLANKKRKHADDIRDYFKANKRLKLSVQYKDQLPGLDDHARTFNSLLLAEIDKRNLNLLKQMRVMEQLRQ